MKPTPKKVFIKENNTYLEIKSRALYQVMSYYTYFGVKKDAERKTPQKVVFFLLFSPKKPYFER